MNESIATATSYINCCMGGVQWLITWLQWRIMTMKCI